MIGPVEFPARDGYALAGMLFRPDTHNGRAVLVNPAVGVKQQFYSSFAAYLAERGFVVLTYDYRGIGASRREPLKGMTTRIRDWARLDAAAALDQLEQAAPGARLLAVCHSFGGNGLGIVPGIERYRAALFVGVQSGYWRHWRGVGRAGMWLLTHALLPALSRSLGYFPSRLFGQGEDLPAGVAIEWASWCRDPRYAAGAVDDEGYARFSARIRSYWIADDRYAPRRATEALLELFPAATKELRPVEPSQHGGGRIGHFGFFRERFRDTLWREAADWLEL